MDKVLNQRLKSVLSVTGQKEIKEDYENTVRLIRYFNNTYPPARLASRRREDQFEWINTASTLWNAGKQLEAVALYDKLYDSLIDAQTLVAAEAPDSGYVHKGEVLYYLGHFFRFMGYPVLAKRHMMLSLIEDSIRDKGDSSKTGVFYDLVWTFGLSEKLVKQYSKEAFRISNLAPIYKVYPEAILQELNQDWMTELPMPGEALIYRINLKYLEYLRSQLHRGDGKGLEYLADYLLSCMPGCRSTMRKRTFSTDLDIVCSLEGFEMDFRSELGRYFVCECKDKTEKIDKDKERTPDNVRSAKATFGEIAKFCRVLDSVKSRFGIVFSPGGITGDNGSTEEDAARELLKMFQDTGTVIVVIDENDIQTVASGQNFISILHEKYEKARLDLRPLPDEEDDKKNNKKRTRLSRAELN